MPGEETARNGVVSTKSKVTETGNAQRREIEQEGPDPVPRRYAEKALLDRMRQLVRYPLENDRRKDE
jgi:hypothetical protein